METIDIQIMRDEVYEEVAKATDYTGSKLIDGDEAARDRILAADDDLAELGRFWEESVLAVNENFKEMLISGATKMVPISDLSFAPADDKITEAQSEAPGVAGATMKKAAYVAKIEVSKSFDKSLKASVQSTLRSFFIASIIGQWFKFANKGEAADYFAQATEMLETAERLLYSRRKPTRPSS